MWGEASVLPKALALIPHEAGSWGSRLGKKQGRRRSSELGEGRILVYEGMWLRDKGPYAL